LIERHSLDFVIANGENSAAGFGITGDIADVLFGYGIDVMTSGNHIFDKKEAIEYIRKQPRLLRPANYPPNTPGSGYWAGQVNGAHVAVMNVMGRVFMPSIMCLRHCQRKRQCASSMCTRKRRRRK
jgi:calcineurin-like phosphoesterase